MIRPRPTANQSPRRQTASLVALGLEALPLAALAAAFAVFAAVPAALAAEDGDDEKDEPKAYVEYTLGVSHVPNQTLHGNSASNANLYGRTEQKPVGYTLGFAAGAYLLDGLRTEAQVGFRSTELDSLAVQSEPDGTEGGARLSLFTAMANAYYDFDLERLAGLELPVPVMPWLGAGIGWGMPRLDGQNQVGPNQLSLDDTDSVFVYNAMAGATWVATRTTSVTVGYRYVGTSQITLNATVGGTPQRLDYEYDAHEGFVGLRFSF